MSATQRGGGPFEDQQQAYLGLLLSIYHRAENMASMRVRISADVSHAGSVELVCERCGEVVATDSLDVDGLTLLEADNRAAEHIGQRHADEAPPPPRPVGGRVIDWGNHDRRGDATRPRGDHDGNQLAAVAAVPALEHCPLCHDYPPDSGDESWHGEHDTYHGNYGCPQCDREAGYPR